MSTEKSRSLLIVEDDLALLHERGFREAPERGDGAGDEVCEVKGI